MSIDPSPKPEIENLLAEDRTFPPEESEPVIVLRCSEQFGVDVDRELGVIVRAIR